MFRKILLATDGSPHAAEALKYARDLALRDGASVVVVHSIPPLSSAIYLGEPWSEEVIRQTRLSGERVGAAAAEALSAAGVEQVEVEVLDGPPADAILRAAETNACDLIVMGSRGYGRIASLLLGSVSHRVLANARVPVMVVRAHAEEDRQTAATPNQESAPAPD